MADQLDIFANDNEKQILRECAQEDLNFPLCKRRGPRCVRQRRTIATGSEGDLDFPLLQRGTEGDLTSLDPDEAARLQKLSIEEIFRQTVMEFEHVR